MATTAGQSDLMQTDAALRQAVIDTALAMNVSGLNQGTSGNVSARAGEGFLVTPSGLAYDALTPQQIVEMDLDGGYRGALLPSSEWRMHQDIYRSAPDAGAVVHVHSPYATALSCLRIEIPAFHYMIAVAGGETLRCADYATFGTQALSDAMLVALEARAACLLANHGQIAYGPTLAKALWRAHEVELLCQQFAIARSVGAPVLLPPEEMAVVQRRFATYGKQPAPGEAPPTEMPTRRDPPA